MDGHKRKLDAIVNAEDGQAPVTKRHASGWDPVPIEELHGISLVPWLECLKVFNTVAPFLKHYTTSSAVSQQAKAIRDTVTDMQQGVDALISKLGEGYSRIHSLSVDLVESIKDDESVDLSKTDEIHGKHERCECPGLC
jgi:hypothetical protein